MWTIHPHYTPYSLCFNPNCPKRTALKCTPHGFYFSFNFDFLLFFYFISLLLLKLLRLHLFSLNDARQRYATCVHKHASSVAQPFTTDTHRVAAVTSTTRNSRFAIVASVFYYLRKHIPKRTEDCTLHQCFAADTVLSQRLCKRLQRPTSAATWPWASKQSTKRGDKQRARGWICFLYPKQGL